MNNRRKKKLQTDEDSMCSFESRWLLLKKNRKYARVAQLVEYDLAKVGVAGSSPVSRSFYTKKGILPGYLFLYKRVLPDSNIRGLHSVPVGANEGPLDLQRRLALFLYIKSIQEGYLFCINESCRTRTGSYLRFTPVGANKGPLDL